MATETKVTGKEKELVDIKYTASAKFHKAGEPGRVHKVQADKLIEKGAAVLASDELPAKTKGGQK